MLPSDPKARKRIPLATGLLDYFPDALADVAGLSLVANEQHNQGEPLHWSRHKSNDHDDCLMRHFMERGTVDSDGIRHRAKVAWRALAALQLEIEAARDREVVVTGRHHLPIRDAVVGQVYGGGCIQGKPGPVPLNLPSDADGS
ncbi:MAG TPA: dATP/dGTP diphosphohydrolase domain-containing protein [Pseudoxanthomonas sp.]